MGIFKMSNPITNNIIRSTKETVNFEDKNMLWEYLKCQIRSQTTLFAGQRSRENAKIENKFKDRLEILEKNLQDSNYTEYLQLKGEWEGIHQKKIMEY